MKRFKISGYCFVPYEVKMTVEAKSGQDALKIASRMFSKDKRSYIVPNSSDESSAHSFEPHLEGEA